MTVFQTKRLHDALLALQDVSYKAFQERLLPNLSPDVIIGIRTPLLRRFAAEYVKSPDAADFMQSLPHIYYEENNLHAFLIETIGDYEQTLAALERFLPYIDNWATCDSLCPKVFAKHTDELIERIRSWILSDKPFTVRFGLEMLMKHYLDKHFKKEFLLLACSVHSDEYYVNMMLAWYFATALTKQYESTLPIFLDNRLDAWTHNKAIQKARESYRVDDEKKAYLKSLKR